MIVDDVKIIFFQYPGHCTLLEPQLARLLGHYWRQPLSRSAKGVNHDVRVIGAGAVVVPDLGFIGVTAVDDMNLMTAPCKLVA